MFQAGVARAGQHGRPCKRASSGEPRKAVKFLPSMRLSNDTTTGQQRPASWAHPHHGHQLLHGQPQRWSAQVLGTKAAAVGRCMAAQEGERAGTGDWCATWQQTQHAWRLAAAAQHRLDGSCLARLFYPHSPSPFAGGCSSGRPTGGTSPAPGRAPGKPAGRPGNCGSPDRGLAALPSPTGTRNTMTGPFRVAFACQGGRVVSVKHSMLLSRRMWRQTATQTPPRLMDVDHCQLLRIVHLSRRGGGGGRYVSKPCSPACRVSRCPSAGAHTCSVQWQRSPAQVAFQRASLGVSTGGTCTPESRGNLAGAALGRRQADIVAAAGFDGPPKASRLLPCCPPPQLASSSPIRTATPCAEPRSGSTTSASKQLQASSCPGQRILLAVPFQGAGRQPRQQATRTGLAAGRAAVPPPAAAGSTPAGQLCPSRRCRPEQQQPRACNLCL